MRRGKSNAWRYDQAPQGEGIVVLHDDLGQRKEVHDLGELENARKAQELATTPKALRELQQYGILPMPQSFRLERR